MNHWEVLGELAAIGASGGGTQAMAAVLDNLALSCYLGFFTSEEPAGLKPHFAARGGQLLGDAGQAALLRSLSERLGSLSLEGAGPEDEVAEAAPRASISAGMKLEIDVPEAGPWARKALCFPVLEGETVVGGVLTTPFPSEDLASVRRVVSFIQVLLSRASLEATMKAHERALDFLNEVYRSNLERQEAEAALGVEYTLCKLSELFHFDAAALALPDGDRWIMLHWLPTDSPARFVEAVREQTLTALSRDQGAQAAQVNHILLWQHRPPPKSEEPNSYFIHTLRFDRAGKCPGMLGLYSASEDMLTTEEMRLLVLLTPGLAIAFRNSQLLFALERQAKHDEMTGLYNYRTFRALLDREFSRLERTGEPLSLLLMDIDFFKKINDTFGHQKGDEVLRSIARHLVESKRGIDAVARYGGEEFVMILPDTGTDGAAQLAEKVRRHLASQTILPERPVTVSVGVATFTSAKDGTEDDLIHRADKALYRAKAGGRNRVEVG